MLNYLGPQQSTHFTKGCLSHSTLDMGCISMQHLSQKLLATHPSGCSSADVWVLDHAAHDGGW